MVKRISESDALSFTEHLEELRTRLIVCALAILASAVIGYVLAPGVLQFLIRPLERAQAHTPALQPRDINIVVNADGTLRVSGGFPDQLEGTEGAPGYRLVFRRDDATTAAPPMAVVGDHGRLSMVYLRPADPFMLILKVTIILGIVLALPVLLWQVWQFVAPGLTKRERKWMGPVILTGSLLFPVGVVFAYFLLSYALRFFATYAVPGVNQQLDVRAYLGFALTTMLSFGIVFELPVAVLLAAQAGIVSPRALQRRRKEVFILLLATSAVLTPTTDPVTLAAMALPLYGLFEASIWVARVIEHRPADEASLADPADTTPGEAR